MDLKIHFSILGIIIFALPMLINIIYAVFPPVNAPEKQAQVNKIAETVEQVTRILYLIAICVLVSSKPVNYKSPWLYMAVVFFVLYHIVWIRYFMGVRDVSLMSKSFLFVPMPLAVFPVLYFICAAIWVHNYPAAVIMMVFGISHNIVTYQSFRQEKNKMKELTIEAPFEDNGFMPKKYTGFGEDMSPELRLMNLDSSAASIAIVMDDLDIPFTEAYNHWLIWNIPPMDVIPAGIPYGAEVKTLGSAVQGMAYGKNRYRGPKQPVFVRSVHRYRFRVYVLDKLLSLNPAARKSELIRAMEGHVIQQGEIVGRYKR